MESRASTHKAAPEAILSVTSLINDFDGIIERATARSQPINSIAEEMLTWAKRSTAMGLLNTARYLQRAASKLDQASYYLATPATNGRHPQAWPFDLMGLDDEFIAPHLA